MSHFYYQAKLQQQFKVQTYLGRKIREKNNNEKEIHFESVKDTKH